MAQGPVYKKVKRLLEEAHLACFKHPDRDVLGMTNGPFSGVNQVLGIVMELEENQRKPYPIWINEWLKWNGNGD